MNKDPLYEVIFDVSINLDRYLNNLDEDEREAIMDRLEGSRGLCFECVLPWAEEFQESWTDRGDEDIDYIIAVDEFTQKKFDALRKNMPKVVSIQVVPTIFHASTTQQNEHVEPQFAGPDHNTTNWSVYERDRKGLAHWVADFTNEGYAMRFGAMLAAEHGVQIEPQPWKEPKKQAEIVTKEVPLEFPFRVHWEIDIHARSPRHAAERAREIQLRSDGSATVFDVARQGRPTVRVDLTEME